jgi:hypothetical protein
LLNSKITFIADSHFIVKGDLFKTIHLEKFAILAEKGIFGFVLIIIL